MFGQLIKTQAITYIFLAIAIKNLQDETIRYTPPGDRPQLTIRKEKSEVYYCDLLTDSVLHRMKLRRSIIHG
jgi:hypothetical protein